MPTSDYEQLQGLCRRRIDSGDELWRQEAYYSGRQALAPYQKRDASGLLYRGKVSGRAFVVSIEAVQVVNGRCVTSETPDCLAGEVILYECRDNPAPVPAEVFMRTGQHHASCGLLRRDVVC